MQITDEHRNLTSIYGRHIFRISQGKSYFNQRPHANAGMLRHKWTRILSPTSLVKHYPC